MAQTPQHEPPTPRPRLMPADWICTYRVQLNAGFGFADLAGIADYLARLGVSHAYLSPILQAAPGSTHGYDVADATRINDELGGEAGYRRASEALRSTGLGQMLDIVPNHMAAATPWNPWWWDVLQNGPASPYAAYFDLGPRADLFPIRLPILGDRYGRVLESGNLKLVREQGEPRLAYGDTRLPLTPQSQAGLDDAAVSGDPQRLHELLQRQHYRLVHWRLFSEAPPYRRFFNIDSLIGLRVEDAGVFAARHRLEQGLVADGSLDGLRVDHVDGLRDPASYLAALRRAAPESRIVIEKILAPGEELPGRWPVQGTTGYDFLNLLNGLFVDPAGEASLSQTYGEFTGESRDYEAVLLEAKRQALDGLFPGELRDLTDLLSRACERYVDARDFPRSALETALREMIVALPVYRTYVVAGDTPDPARVASGDTVDEADLRLIDAATRLAAERSPGVEPFLFDFLRDVLSLRRPGEVEAELVARLQQLSGPAMAKGAEDTAFYRYHRLISLCEVGGDPGRFGTSLTAFHAGCAETARRWPETMLATATHDTKRGEDARVRIDLLSQAPDAWRQRLRTWSQLNAGLERATGLDRNTQYLLYQSLAGAWPVEVERLQQFALKAACEAKLHTTWTDPDKAYERSLHYFVAGLYDSQPFLRDLEAYVATLDYAGRVQSLAQTLIKLTAPGVPDLYQGCELWDHALVDPDNRRPVDFEARRRLLDEVEGLDAEGLLRRPTGLADGVAKLWLTAKTLHLRRAHAALFAPATGTYEPLYAEGDAREQVVAFLRGGRLATVTPRWALSAIETGWGDSMMRLPAGAWRNVFTGVLSVGDDKEASTVASGSSLAPTTGAPFSGVRGVPGFDIPLAELFAGFPVALLLREDS